MAQFIEVQCIIDLTDPYEKTAPKLLNKAFISGDIDYDDYGHIWIKYEGKELTLKGNYEMFRAELLE